MEATDGHSLPIVLPVKDMPDDPENDTLAKSLPKFPSCLCIYASYRSGKSNLLANYFLNSNFYRNRFDRIFLYSPTATNDPTMRYFFDDDKNPPEPVDGVEVIDDPNDWENHLSALIQHQKEMKNSPDEEKIAVAFDDCVGNLGKMTSLMNVIPTKFRHANIRLLIYVSQSYKMLSRTIRTNCKGMIIMKLSNFGELEKIKEEVDGFMDGHFEELYDYCITDQPFSFMFIDMASNPVSVYLRHEKLIWAGTIDYRNKQSEESE